MAAFQLGDVRIRVVEVTRDDRLCGTNHDTSRLEADVDAVSAVITFCRSVSLWIDIECVVGAGLHTSFAANAAAVVEVDHAIFAAIESCDWADFDTRGVVTVIATHHRKKPSRVRKLSLFDVLNPGSIDADRDVVFRLACDGTGVATNTAAVVDDESEVGQLDDACERGRKSNRSQLRTTAS